MDNPSPSSSGTVYVPLPIKYITTVNELHDIFYPNPSSPTSSSPPSSSTITTLPPPPKLIHYKGFGSTITSLPSSSMIDELRTADIIEFDGDNYEVTSFMKIIPEVLGVPFVIEKDPSPSFPSSSLSSSTVSLSTSPLPPSQRKLPILLSFKLLAEKETYFEPSWGKVRIPSVYAAYVTVYCYLVPDYVIDFAHNPLLSYKPLKSQLPLQPHNESILPDDTLSQEQEKYVGLGAYAIQLCYTLIHLHDQIMMGNGGTVTVPSYERKVVCWGGYQVILREYTINKVRSCPESITRLRNYLLHQQSSSSSLSSAAPASPKKYASVFPSSSSVVISPENITIQHALPSTLFTVFLNEYPNINETFLQKGIESIVTVPMMPWEYYHAQRIRRLKDKDPVTGQVVREYDEKQEGQLLQLREYNYASLIIKNENIITDKSFEDGEK